MAVGLSGLYPREHTVNPNLYGDYVESHYVPLKGGFKDSKSFQGKLIGNRKSRATQGMDVSEPKYSCDMCGKKVGFDEIDATKDRISLCTNCHDYMESIPDGAAKMSIERYLIGNVI